MPLTTRRIKKCRREANRTRSVKIAKKLGQKVPANNYWRKAYTNKNGVRVKGAWVKYPTRKK